MREHLTVIAAPNFDQTSEIKRAILLLNRSQDVFRFDFKSVTSLGEIGRKTGIVHPKGVFRAKKSLLGDRKVFAITGRPLQGGYFCDADPQQTSLISTAAWVEQFPMLPLHPYIAWMIASNLPFLMAKLSDAVNDRQEERHERETKGCVSEFCKLITDVWQNMLHTHVCKPCRRELRAAGLSASAASSIDKILSSLRKTNRAYDKKLAPVGFISYSHKDSAFAKKLSADLAQHGLKTFLDIRAIRPADSLRRTISGALRKVRVVLFILSKSSKSSRWCEAELTIALEMERKRKLIIIPILYKQCALPESLADHVGLNPREIGYDQMLAFAVSRMQDEQAKWQRRNAKGPRARQTGAGR